MHVPSGLPYSWPAETVHRMSGHLSVSVARQSQAMDTTVCLVVLALVAIHGSWQLLLIIFYSYSKYINTVSILHMSVVARIAIINNLLNISNNKCTYIKGKSEVDNASAFVFRVRHFLSTQHWKDDAQRKSVKCVSTCV